MKDNQKRSRPLLIGVFIFGCLLAAALLPLVPSSALAAAPTVLSVTPANEAPEITVDTSVTLLFSQPLLASSVNSESVQLKDGAQVVDAESVLDPGDPSLAHIYPRRFLETNRMYTVFVDSALVRDADGASLASDFTSSFTTSSAGLSPHGSYTSYTSQCRNCHTVHGAAVADPDFGGKLFPEDKQTTLCYTCHDGTGASTDVKSSFAGSGTTHSGHVLEDSLAVPGSGLTATCSSCHAPHSDATARPLLPAKTVNGVAIAEASNQWCEACHNDTFDWVLRTPAYPYPTGGVIDQAKPLRASTESAGYPISGTFPGSTTYETTSTNAHTRAVSPTRPELPPGDCRVCHDSHATSASKYDSLEAAFRPSPDEAAALTDRQTGEYAALCFTCHGADGPATNILQFVSSDATDPAGTGGHRIRTAGGNLPVGAPLPCYDCHNPHGSKGNDGTSPNKKLISDEQWSGIDTSTPKGVVDFCFKCHLPWEYAAGSGQPEANTVPAGQLTSIEGLDRRSEANKLSLPGSVTEHGKANRESATPASCSTCHGNSYTPGGHNVHRPGTDATSLHELVLSPNCSGCHEPNLTTEHAGRSCATCHESTDARVIAAIQANNKDCSACHDTHALDASFCGNCHADEQGSYPGVEIAGQSAHSTVTTSTKALTSWPASGLLPGSCANCHGEHPGSTRAAGNQLCFTCHDDASTTKPADYSYQGTDKYQQSGHSAVTEAGSSSTVLYANTSGFAAWESSSMPTPTSPGTPLSADQKIGLLKIDTALARTHLATVTGEFDYQTYRFTLPATSASVAEFAVDWRGFGERYQGNPVTLYLWDVSLNGGAGGWSPAYTGQMTDETAVQLAGTMSNVRSDRTVWVMAKAQKLLGAEIVSGPVAAGSGSAPRIEWASAGLADGWVDYGASPAYGQTDGSAAFTTSHSVQLPALMPGPNYYRVRSTSSDGDAIAPATGVVGVPSPPLTPVASQYWVGGGAYVQFSWEVPTLLYAPFTYDLVVRDQGGTPVHRAEGLTSTATPEPVFFGPGNYSWTVQAWDKDGTPYLLPTPGTFSLVSDGGSCPFLFTWDGTKFAFEADLNTTGMIGSTSSTGYWKPDPRDRYLLTNTPVPKDGALEFRMVEERNEVDYTDELKLYTIDLPPGVDLYAEKGERGGQSPLPPAGLHTVTDLRAPISVVRLDTGEDVTSKITAVDDQYVQLNEDANVGFDYKTLELDLGDLTGASQVKIVMNAETQRPSTAEGLARQRTFGATTKLEVEDLSGAWREVPSTEATLPNAMEFARSYIFDITGAMHDTTGKVRFTFLFKTYINQIAFDTSADQPVELSELPLLSAELAHHGVDARTAEGDIYEYLYGNPIGYGTYFPGTYTRFGEVTPLLSQTDDKFVIWGQGDELVLRFSAPQDPPGDGTRKYLTFIDGYYKSVKSAVPHTVEPLPFAAMSNYPYPDTEHYPDDSEHQAYQAEYNTRVEGSVEGFSALLGGQAATTEPALAPATSGGSVVDRLVSSVASLFKSAGQAVASLLAGEGDEEPLLAAAPSAGVHYSLNTDLLTARVTNVDGSTSAGGPLEAWESEGQSAPTLENKGVAVDATSLAKASAQDSQYWITDLATADKSENWQVARFQVSPVGTKHLQLSWQGHGEPTPGYLTTVSLWNFETDSWEQKSSGIIGTDVLISLASEATSSQACLRCHSGSTPPGVTMSAGARNVGAGWTASGRDAHGARAATGFGGGLNGFARGSGALSCGQCHETHGSASLFHVPSSVNGVSVPAITNGNQLKALCSSCHTGNSAAWHKACNDCHQDPDSHVATPGPLDDTEDCLSCHKHNSEFSHPERPPDWGCHCAPAPYSGF